MKGMTKGKPMPFPTAKGGKKGGKGGKKGCS